MPRPLRHLDAGLSDQVHVELVRSLFALPLPSLVMTALFVGVAALAVRVTGDAALLALAVAGTLASTLRLGVVIGYRRRGVEAHVRDHASATLAERRFAITYIGFAVVLGLFSARMLVSPEIALHMLAVALIVGYAAGAAAGVSLRPLICGASMMLAVVPSALVGLVTVQPFHAVLAAVLLALLAGGLQSVLARYHAEVDKIEMRRTIAGMVRRDHLTGLLNRLGLAERFDAATAGRDADGLIAIHCLDLDRFKSVNDRHGHPVGDALLCLVAERLAKNLRAGDVACRLGGDEFVVLQTGLRGADEAEALAGRLVRLLGQPYCIGEQTIGVGTSIGYVVSTCNERLEDLIGPADNALYAIKAAGGGAAGHSDRRIGKASFTPL